MLVVNDLIAQIEADLGKLQRAYTQFFADKAKKEPHELRRAMESRVRQLRGFVNLRTEEQFRTQNALSKVYSLTKLWDKLIDRKYEGKPRRPRLTPQAEDKPAIQNTQSAPKPQSITIGNTTNEREKVVRLYDEYMRLNLLLGSRKMINFGKFQAFIHSQTKKIQKKKKVDQVQYQVSVQDQQVVIKSKSVK